MADLIYPGQRITVEIKFYLLGVPTDPVVARCFIKDPTGSETVITYPTTEFTRRDIGFFEMSVDVDIPGTWIFRGDAAGVVDAASETQISVQPSSFSI
jgi:hypothetical protein